MKKKVSLLLAVALVLTMLCAFTSCGGGMKNGYYTVSDVLMGEVTYSGDQLKAMGLDESVYVKIDGDGKGEVSVNGITQEMTYDDKQMTINNEPANYEYNNNKITIFYEEYSMSFTFNPNFKP